MTTKFEVVSDRPRAREFLEKFFHFKAVADEKGICLLRDGEVVAATMYYDFNGANIWAHHAQRRKSLTRDFVHWCFHYPFVQLHANRISLWVSAGNAASIQGAEHLGFKREATLRGAADTGEDVLIYRMFREECRYV